ncbi:hypothetical protein LC612_31055 [Nostoc sp. CHAB 5834]|nr:hypothetical protein [Nostoc sp. CHAB 5834]
MRLTNENKLIGCFYFRESTPLVCCSFTGDYEFIRGVNSMDWILTGDRYLTIEKVIHKTEWKADSVARTIEKSKNKIFYIQPNAYLKDSLKHLNNYIESPLQLRYQLPNGGYPKVVFTQITSLKEEKQIFSERDDLLNSLTDLFANGKIRSAPNCGYRHGDDTHKSSLLLLIKPMLPLIVSPSYTLV